MPSYTIRTKRHKLKTGRLLFLLAIFAFLLLLFFTTRFLGTLNSMTDDSVWAQALPVSHKSDPQRVLISTVSDDGNLTSLSLAATRVDKKSVHLILIPINVVLNSDSTQTLAQVYAQGNQKSLVKAVETLLSADIHAFMQIDESEIANVMDLLNASITDAVPVIATNKELSVYLGDDTITLSAQFERRRVIMTALLQQVLQGNVVADIINFRIAAPLVTTNLSWRDILSLLMSFEEVNYNDAAQSFPLPGITNDTEEGTYFVADTDSLPALLVWLDSESAAIPKGQITVEVLNGSGIAGVATSVAQLLRNEGYNVKSIGNADRFDYEFTQVISRTANIAAAKDVAIVIPNAQLIKEENPDSSVLVTVIVGKNYNAKE